MIKNIFNTGKNYKYNGLEKTTNGQDKLTYEQLEVICSQAVEDIIPELYNHNMSEIALSEKSVETLTKEITRREADIIARNFEKRIEALRLINQSSPELEALEETRRRLQRELRAKYSDLYACELELYNETTNSLSQALGVPPSVRSQKTLERQKQELVEKYPNFDIQYVSAVTAFIVTGFEAREYRFDIMAVSILVIFLSIRSAYNGKKYKKETEASIEKGLDLLKPINCNLETRIDKVRVVEFARNHYFSLLENAVTQLHDNETTYKWDVTRDNSRNVDSAKAEVDKAQKKFDYYSQILDYLKSQK
jgi:hypothetical protein